MAALVTKRVDASVSENGSGEFELLLSTTSRDRDGEIVEGWLALPDHIAINANHSSDVSDIVGSGRPFLDSEGNLRVKGTFASSEQAQHIRGLVADGHLTTVSVEFLRHADGNELVGGAFVTLPANPEARVLSAKAFDTALKSVLAGEPLLQAIHDASVHLGAECMSYPADALVDDQDDGADGEDGAADGANKAAALALRIKALRR